jgi:segregation and condensation protein B
VEAVDNETLTAALEGILLTAREPVSVPALVEAFGVGEITAERVEGVLESLLVKWDRPDSGIRLERVAGGWRCVTPAVLDAHLRSYHGVAARQRLSQAALEVLAIAAHRQPVTLPEINFIRGTNSASVVRTLLDRKLLQMAGRKKVVGKPFLYRTSKEFLLHFGLERPEDLPDPEELVREETVPAE